MEETEGRNGDGRRREGGKDEVPAGYRALKVARRLVINCRTVGEHARARVHVIECRNTPVTRGATEAEGEIRGGGESVRNRRGWI